MHRGFGTARLLAAIVTVAFAIGALLGPLCVLIGSCSMPCCHAPSAPSASLATANNCVAPCNAQAPEAQPATTAVAPEHKAPAAPLLLATLPSSDQVPLSDVRREVSSKDTASRQASVPHLYVLNASFLV